jgi:hypothetical protein
MIAAISATAIGVILTGIGVIVAIVVGVVALKTARAAEKQAVAAAKQADVAEREYHRATIPRLRIARFANSNADVTGHHRQASEGKPAEQTLYIKFDNVREATAIISRAMLGSQEGELTNANCEPGRPGIVNFVADPDWEVGSKVRLDVVYRARDGGQAGRLDGELETIDGGWRIVRDVDGQV